MRRSRIAALAAHQDAARLQAWAEFHHGHKAVAALAIDTLGGLFRRHAVCRERTPVGRSVRHWQAGLAVVKWLYQIAGQTLEAVDLAPRRLPGAEVGAELGGCAHQPFEALARRQRGLDVVEHQHFPGLGNGTESGRQVLGPVYCQRGRHRVQRVPHVPAAQRGNLRRQRWPQWIVGRQVVVRDKQLRQQRLERRQRGVVGRRDQAVDGEILAVFHHPHGVDAARVFRVHRHIGRVVAGLGAVRTGCRVRPVVGVIDPAILRVEEGNGFFYLVQALPFGGRVAAIDRMLEVEPGIAARDEIAVEIGDIAVCIRIDGVVRGVGAQLHRFVEFLVVARLGAQERLRERLERLVHQLHGDPLAVPGPHDGAVVAVVHLHRLAGHAAGGLVRQLDIDRLQRALLVAVLVEILAIPVDDGFQVFVDDVAATGRMHPAHPVVKTLVHEELAPGHGAVGVQPLPAVHLHFGTEIERRMRVDHQQRVAVFGDRRCNGKPVGAARLVVEVAALIGQQDRRHHGMGAVLVQRFELLEVDGFDIAADAAFAEGKRHPWLEMRDQVGLDVGMGGQVVVQAVGKGDHQLFQPRRALLVLRFEEVRVDEQLHAQVAPDLGLAFHFGQAAGGGEVVAFDPAEIVLGLGVQQAEHGIGVAVAVHVGNAPSIAQNGHALGLGLHAGQVGASGRCRSRSGRQRCIEGNKTQQGQRGAPSVHRQTPDQVIILGTNSMQVRKYAAATQ